MMRRSPLRRSRPKPVDRNDPQRQLWKTSHAGFCQCGCGRFAMHLERHHVLDLQVLKREHREDVAWDARNAMLLHPQCHGRHTSAMRRIPLSSVPEAALAFAVDVLGEDRACLFFSRYYGHERAAA